MQPNKNLLVLLACILGLSVSQAQSNFSIGPRAGVNFATLTGDDTERGANARPVFGLASTYSITEDFGLSVDLLYSGEGSEIPGANDDLKITYLRLPIMFSFFFRNLGEAIRPKLYLGVNPGLLLGAEVGETEVKTNYNTFDIGGIAGLGINFRIANEVWLNTDFRYLRSFTDVRDEKPANADGLYNRSWQPSIGIAFGL